MFRVQRKWSRDLKELLKAYSRHKMTHGEVDSLSKQVTDRTCCWAFGMAVAVIHQYLFFGSFFLRLSAYTCKAMIRAEDLIKPPTQTTTVPDRQDLLLLPLALFNTNDMYRLIAVWTKKISRLT